LHHNLQSIRDHRRTFWYWKCKAFSGLSNEVWQYCSRPHNCKSLNCPAKLLRFPAPSRRGTGGTLVHPQILLFYFISIFSWAKILLKIPF